MYHFRHVYCKSIRIILWHFLIFSYKFLNSLWSLSILSVMYKLSFSSFASNIATPPSWFANLECLRIFARCLFASLIVNRISETQDTHAITTIVMEDTHSTVSPTPMGSKHVDTTSHKLLEWFSISF